MSSISLHVNLETRGWNPNPVFHLAAGGSCYGAVLLQAAAGEH